MNGKDILQMKEYLTAHCLQYDDTIHVMVAERRAGKHFSLEEHIAALVYAQLTNQTKWSRIVPHLAEIDALFFHYDPKEIQKQPSSYFSDGIFALKCGNISTKAQMNSLHRNISKMQAIAEEFGSMDAFVTSAPAQQIVELLSSGKSKYKIAMLGEALAWEYIRNVGIDGCKPDTHLRRFLGNDRMGNASESIASINETIQQIEALATETNLPLSSIDNIIWSYCADGYGEICTATPHCEKCVVRSNCKNSRISYVADDERLFTYEVLRKICVDCNMDPAKIGQFVLDVLKQQNNSVR